tara:strand:+ start:11611 stop:12117 length:507 start_codon:yes stop_codon:yes gene_type:complete
MKIVKRKINNCLILKFEKFEDHRGKYIETFNKKNYKNLNIDFVQDDFSYSKKNVLRGFHGDKGTFKLFKCIKGKVQFAVINNDERSNFYKKNFTMILSEDDCYQVLVPPKHGVAHLILSSKAILHYKQSTYYKDFKQFTINYKSKCLSFKWKSKKIITSSRDSGGIIL